MDRTGIGLVCLSLCVLIYLVRGQANVVNVALGKTYSQSSKFNDQNDSPTMAANGNTSRYYPANCIHTDDNNDLYPWWQVDLGTTYPVYDITVWARNNNKRRLYPSNITVDGQTCTSLTPFPADSREQTVTCSSVMYGRKVRITRQATRQDSTADRTLNLCEMQIWVCQDGYHRTNPATCVRCSANCLNQSCDKVTGNCNDCVDGRYGNQCGMVCPTANCRQCHQDSGTCLQCTQDSFLLPPDCTECQDGYYKTSPTTCVRCSINCQSQNCSKQTGKCNGCIDGRYRDMCTDNCSASNCRRCDQDSGECEECALNSFLQLPSCTECQDRYYKTSPTTCVLCSFDCQSQNCSKETGKCHGCIEGRYQAMCTDNCPTVDCRRCDQDSGVCEECALNSFLQPPDCTECQDGYYRTSSGSCVRCNNNCLSQSCDKQTGKCNGCIDGRYQDMCTVGCPTSSCRRCGQDSGECVECALNSFLQPPDCKDCLDGYYKPSPSDNSCERCTWTCQSGTVCDKTTGHCPLCPPGRQGDRCNQDCDAGKYGENCTGECGRCLNNQRPANCDVETGHCVDGCQEGWQTPLCSETVVKGGHNIPAIVGGVVAAILVILIIVIVIFVIRRRRRGGKSRALESEEVNTTRNGRERREPEPTGSSPLSFAPVIVSSEKPKAEVKPVPKPAVKPKPTRIEGGIYENVSLPHENTATSGPTSASTNPSSHQTSAASGRQRPQSAPLTEDEELDTLPFDEEPVYGNDPSYTNFMRVDQLQKTVVDSLQDGKIADEFQFMVGFKQYPVTIARKEENKYKNRFKSIVPYDRNRVVLEQVDGDSSSDYINASFIKGYVTVKAYIACQGPRPNTVDDMWRMVWQEGVTDIVMLTNVKEGIKVKCHGYWPAKGQSLNTGHMEVTGLEEIERAHFVIRTFKVGKHQGQEKRRVRQYHYVKWMDHEVPTATPLINFWRYVRARAPRTASAPPLLVHCSAGVGRTGTYIALDILMDQIQKEEIISIYQTVDNLRKYRCYMVQNKGQYEFLHEAVLEAYQSGDSRLDTSSFDRIFPEPIHHQDPQPRIDKEFERLCQMRTCLTVPSHTVANLEENRQKNRTPDVLPDDKHLVYITEHTGDRNQYINAVYMPTFLSTRGSIVTQLPLKDTVIDMWRLVDSWDVTTIVSIGQVDDRQGTCPYWPKATQAPVRCGPYTISFKSRTSLGETVDSYTVDVKKRNQSREVRVLHYEAWTGEVADNVSDLICLLETLHTSHTDTVDVPIVVQCIDGVAQSGALCALWELISRVICDDDIDVYLAVRHVHTVRPEAITKLAQYRFLYQVVQQYRQTLNVYANT